MGERYPEGQRDRDRWILARRGERNALDPFRAYGAFVEEETGPDGAPVPVATLLLTNRECPFRCLMCDLWQNTLPETVPEGAIAAQIERARAELPPARWLKLYNAGCFFDPAAIPVAEYGRIAELCAPFERVIVECHPAVLGRRCLEFRQLLPPATRLEVAMGLETVHPEVLPRLNKRMTLDQFRRAAEFLARHDLDLRAFILIRPPWLSDEEGLEWACRSLDFAFDCGAQVCTLIPTRAGNGAMDELAAAGQFQPPSLSACERALEHGLGLGRGRVFLDLWELERIARCAECAPARTERLRRMNAEQRVLLSVACSVCAG